MFVINFFRFINGYLTVAFSGEFAERLINICAKNRITLWNIKRDGDKIFVCLSVSSFKKLRILRRKCKVKVAIVSRHGFSFFLMANRLRFGAAVGVALYFLVIHFLSGYIWRIEVVCPDSVDSEQILMQLESMGIKKGIRKKDIDTNNQPIELIMNVDSLSWAALNIEGTELTVDVTLNKDIIKKDNQPSNLISIKDGVITKVRVSSGQTLVSVDQAVLKGDMLVSGVIEDKMGNTNFKHSEGEIIAKTTAEITQTVNFEVEEHIRTGKVKTRSVIEFFGIKIPLYLGHVKFEYQKQVDHNDLIIGGKALPLSLTKAKFFETKQITTTLDYDQALAAADKAFEQQMQDSNYISFTIDDKKITQSEDAITVTYCITGEENIAEQEFLSISTTK